MCPVLVLKNADTSLILLHLQILFFGKSSEGKLLRKSIARNLFIAVKVRMRRKSLLSNLTHYKRKSNLWEIALLSSMILKASKIHLLSEALVRAKIMRWCKDLSSNMSRSTIIHWGIIMPPFLCNRTRFVLVDSS